MTKPDAGKEVKPCPHLRDTFHNPLYCEHCMAARERLPTACEADTMMAAAAAGVDL